jgi:amidase
MSALAFRAACELTNLIRKREISSRELLEHYLTRIEEFNPKLNAVVTIDADRARERADAADQALARGESWGPLHGLPITVKDTFETAGVSTTAGARRFSEYVSMTDAVSVARLQAAGAVLMGKTNTPVASDRLPSAAARRIRVWAARLSASSEIPRRRAPMGE